jgi:hypothetical protein
MSLGGLIEIHARERLDAPPGWQAFFFSRMPPNGPTLYFEVRGAVVPLLTRGKRKGQPDWKARDRSTERTAYIPVAEHDAWVEGWRRRTGLCTGCLGKREVFAAWSKADGTKYMTCPDCGGTGKADQESAMNQEVAS